MQEKKKERREEKDDAERAISGLAQVDYEYIFISFYSP